MNQKICNELPIGEFSKIIDEVDRAINSHELSIEEGQRFLAYLCVDKEDLQWYRIFGRGIKVPFSYVTKRIAQHFIRKEAQRQLIKYKQTDKVYLELKEMKRQLRLQNKSNLMLLEILYVYLNTYKEPWE